MAYATVADVAAGFRSLSTSETAICAALLDEAAVIIDAYNYSASLTAKKVVSCRMVRRTLGDGSQIVPVGATQGTMSAGGYSQSWTLSNGSSGELYLGRIDKKLLGAGNHIGASNPYEDLINASGN